MKTTRFHIFGLRIFLGLFLISGHSIGATQVVKENGKPLEVRWDDGRIVRFAVAQSKDWKGEVPLQISENSCSDKPAKGCLLRAYLRVALPVMYWEKHTDPERVGKIVKAKLADSQELFLHFPYFLTMDNRIDKQAIAATLPVDEILCEIFAWLPETTAIPERLMIPRWNVESMAQNPETGLNENRVIGGGIGVELEKRSANSLGIMRAHSLFGPNRTLIQGDILAWILRFSSGEHCQLSIKANVSKFNNEVTSLYYDTLSGFKPTGEYLWGSDLFSGEYFPSYFNAFLSKPEHFNPI